MTYLLYQRSQYAVFDCPNKTNVMIIRGRGRGKMGTGICNFFNWEIGIGFLGTGMPEGGNGKILKWDWDI